MKILLYLLIATLAHLSHAADKQKPVQFPSVPNLKDGEYAVFIEDKYEIFKTTKIDALEVDTSCGKQKPPKCEAYLASKNPAPAKPPPHPELNHPAALNCQGKGGRNLIAYDSKKNQVDFCRFKDKSMVESWSLYVKKHPVQTIR